MLYREALLKIFRGNDNYIVCFPNPLNANGENKSILEHFSSIVSMLWRDQTDAYWLYLLIRIHRIVINWEF